MSDKDLELIPDRKQLAVDLRQAGIDVDFEDWDGLDDQRVLEVAKVLVRNAEGEASNEV